MDCSPPGSSVHGDSPGENTGVGCHALLQGIFPTQVWSSLISSSCGQFREQGAINQGSSPEGTPTLKGIYTWRTRSHYWHTAVTEGSCPLSASQLRSWSEADMVEMGAALGPTEKWMTCSPEPLSSPALSRSAQLPDWKSSLLKT